MDKDQEIITETEFSIKIALLKKHHICHSGYISAFSLCGRAVRMHERQSTETFCSAELEYIPDLVPFLGPAAHFCYC